MGFTNEFKTAKVKIQLMNLTNGNKIIQNNNKKPKKKSPNNGELLYHLINNNDGISGSGSALQLKADNHDTLPGISKNDCIILEVTLDGSDFINLNFEPKTNIKFNGIASIVAYSVSNNIEIKSNHSHHKKHQDSTRKNNSSDEEDSDDNKKNQELSDDSEEITKEDLVEHKQKKSSNSQSKSKKQNNVSLEASLHLHKITVKSNENIVLTYKGYASSAPDGSYAFGFSNDIFTDIYFTILAKI